jgi:hypothetical protein
MPRGAKGGTMSKRVLPILAVLLLLVNVAYAAGARETHTGSHAMTNVAGPQPPASSFTVTQGGDRISYNGDTYQFDPASGRYKNVKGEDFGWIELNPAGDGTGGYQYQPPGGATGSAGAYAAH